MLHIPITAQLSMVNMPPAAKRTRILAKAQSKTGCFTCKARKVRCDEGKPNCARCIKANFRCEGYPTRDELPTGTPPPSSDTSQSPFTTSIPSAAPVFSGMSHGYTMRDAISLLCRGGTVDIGSAVLSHVLSETAILWPSAIAALRVLETLTGLTGSGNALDEVTRIHINTDYGEAVRLLSTEIAQRRLDTTTVVVTCIILTAVEVLSRRRQNALKHFTAALALSRGQSSQTSILTHLACLFKIYDLQILLYSDGVCLPNVGAINLSQLGSMPGPRESYEVLEHYVINLIHAVHCAFAQSNNEALIENLDEINFVDKPAYIGHILLANHGIAERIRDASGATSTRGLLMLQNLCLMTLIELEQIDSKDEVGWDNHLDSFQMIIENGEKILTNTSFASANHGAPTFTLQLGPIPAIRLVALKCRHPGFRRRAISCLYRAGVEGPFVGTLIAALAQRCMEIEEGDAQAEELKNAGRDWVELHHDEISEAISEPFRITKCCTIEEGDESNGNPSPLTSVGITSISIARRKQPCLSLEAGIISSSYFQIDTQFESVRYRTLNPAKWDVWTESLSFGAPPERDHNSPL